MRITQAVIQFRDKLCTLDTVLDEVMAKDKCHRVNHHLHFRLKNGSGIVTVMI